MGVKRACVVAVLLLVGCTPAAQPSTQTQSMTVEDASASPLATTSASAAPSSAPAPEPRRNGPTLKATASMKMEGTLDEKRIVEAANENAVGLQQCAVAVRSSDKATGSLNLQITVSANGAVTGDLQSPASNDAKKCILDLVKTWKVAGAGKAMVLLAIQD